MKDFPGPDDVRCASAVCSGRPSGRDSLLSRPFLEPELPAEYGKLYSSVTIVFWSFVAAMVILGPVCKCSSCQSFTSC